MLLCSGLNQGVFNPAGEESVKSNSNNEDMAQTVQNGENWTERAAACRDEWGKTSPPAEDQWGRTSDNWVMSTTWDMQLDSTGDEGRRLEPVE